MPASFSTLHRTLYCLIGFLAATTTLSAQIFTASQDTTDSFITLDWSIPVDPCLLQANERFERAAVQLKDESGAIIHEQAYDDLSSFYGRPQPEFQRFLRGLSADDVLTYAPPNSVNYTVELWINLRGPSDRITLVGDSEGANIHLLRDGDNYRAAIGDRTTAPFSLTPETWAHLSFVGNGLGRTRVHVNGQARGTIEAKLEADELGRIPLGTNFDFAQLRVWGRVRTAEEIRGNFPNLGQSRTSLVTLLEVDGDDIVAADSVTYDVTFADKATLDGGVAQNGSIRLSGTSIEGALLPYVVTPDYRPLTGTFRHRVGPGRSVDYRLELELFGLDVNTPAAGCTPLAAMGRTLPYQAPTDLEATTTAADRVTLSWRHNSNYVIRYEIRRTGADGVTVNLPVDLASLRPGQRYSVTDAFRYEEENSLVSGESYTYTLVGIGRNQEEFTSSFGEGATRDLGFSATDASQERPDRVVLTWDSLPPGSTAVEIRRNGQTLARLSPVQLRYVDEMPIYGEEALYELRLLRNDVAYVSAYDLGAVPPNGAVSGRVITRRKSFPVSGITLRIQGSDGVEQGRATTDEAGRFEFSNLSYGLSDTLLITVDPLARHDFLDVPRRVVLSSVAPVVEDVVIFDAFTYNAGFASLEVQSVELTPVPLEDRVAISWVITGRAENVSVQIIRDGQLIYQRIGQNQLTGSFDDLTGAPGRRYRYLVRAFSIDNDDGDLRLVSAEQSALVNFPTVASVPDLAAEFGVDGFVHLDWDHTSTNSDGYRIYRNDSLIAELPADATTYRDAYARPENNTRYQIAAFRTVDALTSESERTAAEPIVIPSIPTVASLTASALPGTPAVELTWSAPVANAYNFSGYRIYRAGQLVATIFKGQPLRWVDFDGAATDGAYGYSIELFVDTPDAGSFASARTASGNLAFPPLPAPAALAIEKIAVTGGAQPGTVTIRGSWTYSPGVTNYDGFVLFGTGGFPLDTFAAGTFRGEVLVNYAPANERIDAFSIAAYREAGTRWVYSAATPAAEVNETEVPVMATIDKPLAFTASRNLLTHVKLCWDNDVISSTRVFRNDSLLAELAPGTENYYDYTAEVDTAYRYEVQSVRGQEVSQRVAAIGRLFTGKTITGRVYAVTTNQGISGVRVTVTGQGAHLGSTLTDATGFYRLADIELSAGTAVTVAAAGANTAFTEAAQLVTITDTTRYAVDFVSEFAAPIVPDSIARFAALLSETIPEDRSVLLRWTTSSGNYDGIEIRRGTELLGFLLKDEPSVYLDSLVAPGIRYTYQLRPYLNTERGRRVGAFRQIVQTVARLSAPTNVTARRDDLSNQVTVQWSHPYDNHTGYRIERNGELVAAVPTGGVLAYVDRTGTAGRDYVYRITAVEVVGRQPYFSEAASVATTFPVVARPQDARIGVPSIRTPINPVVTVEDYTLNHVRLSWEYADTSALVAGFTIYRNDRLIATVGDSVRSYADYTGLPGTPSEYRIAALRGSEDGTTVESSTAPLTVEFPVLSQPHSLSPRVSRFDGTISFTYRYPVAEDGVQEVDKFFVYRGSEAELSAADIIDTVYITADDADGFFTYADATGIPGATYFYGFQAEAIKNNVAERSVISAYHRALEYPNIAPPRNLRADNTQGYNSLVLTWDYPEDNDIDRFEINAEIAIDGQRQNISITVGPEFRRSTVDVQPLPRRRPYADVRFTYRVTAVKVVGGNTFRASAETREAVRSHVLNQVEARGTSQFGWDLKMNDEWLIVGAPAENGIGAVHIYKYSVPLLDYVEHQVIRGRQAGERFGHSLDQTPDRFIVGSPEYDKRRGRVVIYKLVDDRWVEEHEKIGEFEDLELGFDVTIDAGLAVASMPNIEDVPVMQRPSGYRYYTLELVNGEWVQRPLFGISGRSAFTRFTEYSAGTPGRFREGHSIDLQNGTLAVSRLEKKFNRGEKWYSYEFAFYEFDRNRQRWTGGTRPRYQPSGIHRASMDLAAGYNVNLVTGYTFSPGPSLLTNHEVEYTIGNSRFVRYDQVYYSPSQVRTPGFLLSSSNPTYTYQGSFDNCAEATIFRRGNVHNSPVNIRFPDRIGAYGVGENTDGYGKTIDVTNNMGIIGTPGVAFPYDDYTEIGGAGFIAKFLPRELREFSRNFFASREQNDAVELTWGSRTLPDRYLLYRDDLLIADLAGGVASYSDRERGDIPAPEPGKIYTYSLVPVTITSCPTTNVDSREYGKVSTARGSTARAGKLAGFVVTSPGSTRVPGVTITATAFIDGVFITETTETDRDGNFAFDDLLIGEYTLVPTFENHRFRFEKSNVVTPVTENPQTAPVVIFDETAFVIQGTVAQAGVACGLPAQKVIYQELIDGRTIRKDSVLTGPDGRYSLVVNPNSIGLEQLSIVVENVQPVVINRDSTARVRRNFVAGAVMTSGAVPVRNDTLAAMAFMEPGAIGTQTTLDFTDELTYRVPAYVQTACGDPIDGTRYRIRVYTTGTNACFLQEKETDAAGFVAFDLPTLDVQAVVVGTVSDNPTPLGSRAASYLRTRPLNLPLAQRHLSNGLTVADTARLVFDFHTATRVNYNVSAFDRYLCDDPTRAAIVQQNATYRLRLTAEEEHGGVPCAVEEGYFVVSNSGAVDGAPRRLDYDGVSFPSYVFTAAGPNLVAPHQWTVNVQYFANSGSLLAERAIPYIIEGARPLPGAGLTIKLDEEDGEIQLPAFILRDPPGDGSSTTIERGSSSSSEITFASENQTGAGVYSDGEFTVFKVGAFYEINVIGGGGSNRTNTFTVESELAETISTSDSDDFVGRAASIVVGTGIASSYGVLQGIRVVDCDSVQFYTDVSFSPDGITTQWSYTIGFIENLIAQLESDRADIATGNLLYRYEDGTLYTEEAALSRVAAEIAGWEQVIEYFDVQTLPHYILCADDSYRNSLTSERREHLDDWRGAFCNDIGTYTPGGDFILDDRIIWTDELVTKFRNTTAVVESIRELRPADFDNGDLRFSQSEYNALDRRLTQIYESRADTSVRNVSLSGGVDREFSFSTTRSGSTDIGFSRFFSLETQFGLLLNSDTEIGFIVSTNVESNEFRLGAAIQSEASINVNQANGEEESSTVTVSLSDDDADDNYSVTMIPSPLANHSPYFALTGGQSSCPGEEALSSRDNAPLQIDNFDLQLIDPTTGAVGTSLTKNNVPTDGAALFQLEVKNITNLNLTRFVEILVSSNDQGALISSDGIQFGGDTRLQRTLTGDETETIFFTVARNPNTPFFEYENIRIALVPNCAGVDASFELFEATSVDVTVRFQQPCSKVTLGAPLSGWVVNRVNANLPDDRESVTLQLYDIDVDNPNLDRLTLEYRRLGDGSGWEEIEQITLARIREQYDDFALDDTPFFRYNWDITGQYDDFPDGDYAIRAVAICNATGGGEVVSNEVTGSIRRSPLNTTGVPQPADGVWVPGDDISVTYSRNLDCGIVSAPRFAAENFRLRPRDGGPDIPITVVCANGKLTLRPVGSLEAYDGQVLVASYRNVRDASGNTAADIDWPFRVVTQRADWEDGELTVEMYQGERRTLRPRILNATGNPVGNLELLVADGLSAEWLTINPSGTFDLPPSGRRAELVVDGDREPGIYRTELVVGGLDGRAPRLPIKVTILPPPPVVGTVPTLTNQMRMVLNWRFEELPEVSTDTLDQIQVFIDGELRAQGNVRSVGPFYGAQLRVQGREEDAGKPVTFRVWHSNGLTYYEGVALSGTIRFDRENSIGTLDQPELIIVQDEIMVSTDDAFDDPNGSGRTLLQLSSAPNPFSQRTTIRFTLPRAGETDLRIVDALGRVVFSQRRRYAAGEREVEFRPASQLPAGLYVVELKTASARATHSLLLQR